MTTGTPPAVTAAPAIAGYSRGLLHGRCLSDNIEDFMHRAHAVVCHVRDEPIQLRSLLRSATHLANLREIVVVDHRSDPSLASVAAEFADGRIRYLREEREFCRSFTFADLRGKAVAVCEADVVHIADADFVYGPGYDRVIACVDRVFQESSDMYAIGYPIPVIDQPPAEYEFSADGTFTIRHHGRCVVHPAVPRAMLRQHVIYRQDHCGKRFEWAFPCGTRHSWGIAGYLKDSVFSLDIKSEERRCFRFPMSYFFAEVLRSGSKYSNMTYPEFVRRYWSGLLDPGFMEAVRLGTLSTQTAKSKSVASIVGGRFFGLPEDLLRSDAQVSVPRA